MELWIRSQKNEKLRPLLLKVNEIEIGDYDDDMNCIVVNNLHCVGIYNSKERALEVLNEIQNILMPKPINFSELTEQEKKFAISIMQVEPNCIEKIDTYVYEMPKD